MLRSHVCIQGRLWHSTAPHEFAKTFALLNVEILWNINISFAHFNTPSEWMMWHWMFLHNYLPATDFGGYCRSRRKPRKLVELDVINGTGPFAILCSKTCFVASANVVAACLLRPSILDLRSMSQHLQFAHHELPTAFPMIPRRIIPKHTHTTAAFICHMPAGLVRNELQKASSELLGSYGRGMVAHQQPHGRVDMPFMSTQIRAATDPKSWAGETVWSQCMQLWRLILYPVYMG